MLTIAQIINIAKISLYLSLNDVAKGALYGGRLDPNLPRKIYIEYRILEWMYINNPTESTLRQVANYVYELCGMYSLEAYVILNGGGGGGIVPITPGTQPSEIEFLVEVSGSVMIEGQSSLTIPAFRGFNLMFVRNGITQSMLSSQPTYYTWDRTSAVFTCSIPAVATELFQFYPF